MNSGPAMKPRVNASLIGLILFGAYVITRVGSVSIPSSQGSSRRTFTVSSNPVLHKLEEHNGDNEVSSWDNSYDDAITASANNSTASTALLLGQILRGEEEGGREGGVHRTVDILGKVKNPGVVAIELENVAKYLTHQAEVEESGRGVNGTSDNAGVADLTRVLDGFVLLNNLYDSLVRPEGEAEGGRKGATMVDVDIEVLPWFIVNEPRNEMSVTVTVIQNWTDTRVAYQSRLKEPRKFQDVTLTGYMHMVEVWLPDTFIVNAKRSTVVSDLLRISPFGDVYREQRVSVVLSCPFQKSKLFPFDSPGCSLNMASFSWNPDQVLYRWVGIKDTPSSTPVSIHSSGFTLSRQQKSYKTVNRNKQAVLALEFTLQRNLVPYVTKFYLPLACFSLVAILGLIQRVGGRVGAGLSYFVFGLMSIFMEIRSNELNYASARTRLDSYYLACLVFVVGTGVGKNPVLTTSIMVHLLRTKQKSSKNTPTAPPKSPHTHQESCFADDTPTSPRRVKSLRNGSSTHSTTPAAVTRLWSDSADNDDYDYPEEATSPGDVDNHHTYVNLPYWRSLGLHNSVTSTLFSWWTRVLDNSSLIFLGLFASWNVYYYYSYHHMTGEQPVGSH